MEIVLFLTLSHYLTIFHQNTDKEFVESPSKIFSEGFCSDEPRFIQGWKNVYLIPRVLRADFFLNRWNSQPTIMILSIVVILCVTLLENFTHWCAAYTGMWLNGNYNGESDGASESSQSERRNCSAPARHQMGHFWARLNNSGVDCYSSIWRRSLGSLTHEEIYHHTEW